MGTLFLVATPIGNLKDITYRAVETLQKVDAIVCEDTRRTSLLLNHLEIKKPLIILNDFNESHTISQITDRLHSGDDLAVVSDAGTPLISDPGFKLVRECLKAGIKVDSLPGPASPIVALTLAGLPPDKFTFLGYFPEKPGARQNLYESLKKMHQIYPMTFILFIAPFKLKKVLAELAETLSDANITLARELTKIHQEVVTQKAKEWIEIYSKKEPKGEYIMLIRLD